jgi:hypothetical protein
MRDDADRMSSPGAVEEPHGQPRADGAPLSGDSDAANPGVLENLPSTRPQRPSARRAAARRASEAKARPRRARKSPSKLAEPPVPPQGFEAEEQIEPGRPVQPPSGSDLAASVAELVGETAQAGLSAGGRLVKDALRRLVGG